jgi:WD40 repeat protein
MTFASPYKGLDAFADTDLDALLFFGREREREIVVANLIAARLTILYGPTGVGKSSLLRAGVARALRELPEQPLVVVFDHWADDPSADLAAVVAQASGEDPGDGLLDVVERAQQARDVYLVLDQAEEYFVYHQQEEAFDVEIARLVGDPLRVNVLLSLREDSLAKLDRFKARIPSIYANSLRLDRLDREEGRMAIVRPVERWNELENDTVTVEPPLVEAVLDGVRAGRIEQGGGRGGVEGNGRPSSVEAPYLQLVMQRVWEVERAADSHALRAATLAGLGGARQVVADHLDRAIAELSEPERDVAAQLFTFLVTPSGTKIAHDLPDLAEYAGVGEAEAAPVVDTLSRHRILRPDEAGRIEIFHDVLAAEVLAWRRSHNAIRALERERVEARRRHRRLAWLAGLAFGALALTALLAVFALAQRSDARSQGRQARADELDASAAAQLDKDPELSLLLALEAARRVPSQGSESMLRRALLASRERAVVSVGKPLLGAVRRGPNLVVATRDGRVIVADRRSHRRERTYATGARAAGVSFAEDGTALLTGQDGRLRLVLPRGRTRELRVSRKARAGELSPDGSLAAVVDRTGVQVVQVATGRVLQTLSRPGIESAAISRDDADLLLGGFDETITLWHIPNGRFVRSFPHHEKHAVAVAFSPSGRLIASASTDNLARVWQVASGDLVGISTTHQNALTDVEFSADSDLIVTASKDGTARVTKADGGALLVTLIGHNDAVTSAEFSGGDPFSVVTASADGTARVWDATFQPQLRLLRRMKNRVVSVRYVRAHTVRVLTADGRAHIIDTRTGRQLRVGPGGARAMRSTAPDGTTATIRGKVVVLRSPDGRVRLLGGHRDRIYSVAFSPDGSLLATASKDHDARVWEVATAQTLFRLQHNTKVRDAQFSPDGRWVVTASGRVAVWDTRDGSPIVRLQGHRGAVAAAAFDPSGRWIATGGDDHTVRIYRCSICGGIDELVKLAKARLAITGRTLTARERAKYLG